VLSIVCLRVAVTAQSQCGIADTFVPPLDSWRVTQPFGNYNPGQGGYHPGSDIHSQSGDTLGKPVYAAGNGIVKKVSLMGSGRGYMIAIQHSGQFTIQQKFLSDGGQKASYNGETVSSIYTVYLHLSGDSTGKTIKPPPVSDLNGGDCVQKGVTLLGYVINSGLGAHLHFEVRLSTMKPSNSWQLVAPASNWAVIKNVGNPGYYLNLQQMLDSGMRDAVDFVNFNGGPLPVLPDGYLDDVNCTEIRGWAMDRNHPNNKVTIEVRDNGSLIASPIAAMSRPDLDAAGIGAHAFSIPMPTTLKNALSHTISVKISGEASDLKTSPRSFHSTCGTNPTAVISMSGGNQSGGTGNPLNFLVSRGSNIQINFNSFASKTGAAAIKAYNWLRQTILPNKAGSVAVTATTSSNVAPSFSDTLGPGTHNITLQVSDEAGGTDTTTATVVISETQAGTPSISSITPGSVTPSVFNLTISGNNFDASAIEQIYFGNNFVGNGTILSHSNTQIVVQESMSTATLGTYTVKVKNSDGQLSNGMPLVLTQTQTSAPSISSISPASVAPGVFDLTINGSNFDNGAIDQVFFGSSLVGSGTIRSRTNNQIVVTESMPTATLGTYTIKVKNSNGQVSNGLGLTLTQAHGPTPAITSMSPNPVPGAAANQTVGVFGSGFVNGSGLKVRVTYPGGQTDLQGSQVNFISSTQVNILINVGTTAAN